MATRIKNVDFHCQSNNTAHHTDEITTKQLIVRRGQSFVLTLELTRPFNAYDPLTLTVETGPSPSERCGTRSEFGNPSPMYTSDVKAIWKYKIDQHANLQRGIVTLCVTPPVDAPVGKYSLSATVDCESNTLGTLVVLFNPWCSDDWVYLPDERERQEYVMNEDGYIWKGTSDGICSSPWIFGQFEEDMVDICLKMLDVNPKYLRDPAADVSARCNPIYVSRVVSAMINSNGDHGVLEGRWNEPYSDGIPPTHWNGSVKILQIWYGSYCKGVKYGQCWVFAGVMCTVMRFLGIPCRVVTNFQSAHDTNNSLTIDEFYDEHGLTPKTGKDSVWNFHVWVEGWMKRPDLMKGDSYDGWQVLDPTPQEKSEGVFCCGPAPVKAICQGEANLKYDVPFVFAEVNADIVRWMMGRNGKKRKMHSDTRTVGKYISTKAVGYTNARNDITDSYKPREGSANERAVFRRALNRVNSGDGQGDESREEPLKVEMKFKQEHKTQSGEDIHLKLKLSNKDSTYRIMSIRVNAQAMNYNGTPVHNMYSTIQEKMLQSGQDEILPIQIPFSVYGKYMRGCDSVKVSAVATDSKQDDDIYETEIDIVLVCPPVTIEVLGEARLYREMNMVVKFKNPLNETLRNCSLTICGSGLFKDDCVKGTLTELEPKKTMQIAISTFPYKAGQKTVVADFDCSAFRDITGTCLVDVKV